MRSIICLCGWLLIVSCSGGSPGMSGDGGRAGGTQSGSGGGGVTGGQGGTSAGSGGTTGGTGGMPAGSGGTTAGTGGATTGSDGGGGHGGAASNDGGADTNAPPDLGADAVLSCAEIETTYEVALKTAQRCNPHSVNQCQKSAAGRLADCAGCLILVNDDTELNKLKQTWLQSHCQAPIVCPNMGLVCLPPQGDCVATANDAGGICGN